MSPASRPHASAPAPGIVSPARTRRSSIVSASWSVFSGFRADAGRTRRDGAAPSPDRFDAFRADRPAPSWGAAMWLGQSTVLLRFAGLTILTDPVLSNRIGLRLGPVIIGPARLIPSPFRPDELPPIDLVLLSHAHFDHLDRPTLRALRTRRTTVLAPTRTRCIVPRGFADIHELAWGAEHRIGDDVRIRVLRPNHWGARMMADRHRGFNAYVIESPTRRILYAGDTAHTHAFDTLGGADLAIFGIDSYDPWIHAHASPEQVWSMFRKAGGQRLLPVHHSTFRLGMEPPGDPMRRLIAAAGEERDRIIRCSMGEVIEL